MNQKTTSMYQIRLDTAEKNEVFQIFNEMGLKPSQAIKLFLRKVKETRSMPFEISAPKPNQETLATIQKTQQGKELTICKSADDMFDKLGI